MSLVLSYLSFILSDNNENHCFSLHFLLPLTSHYLPWLSPFSFLSLLHMYSLNKRVCGVCPVGSLAGVGGTASEKDLPPALWGQVWVRGSPCFWLCPEHSLANRPGPETCALPWLSLRFPRCSLAAAFSANSGALRGSVPRGDAESCISGLPPDRWICKHSHLVWDLVYFLQSLTEHVTCKKSKWPRSIT